MKNLALLIIPLLMLFLFPETAFSQQGQVKDIAREDLEELGNSEVMRTKQATKTQGSPYLNTTFLKGEAIISGGATTQVMYLRLNTEDNTVEILRNEEIQLLDKSKIEGFRIFTNEEDALFKKGFKSDEHDIKQSTFLRVMYDGITKFVAHHSSSLKEDLPSYGSATQKNAYVSFMNYYIITPDGTFHEIELNKDDILSVLSDQRQQLEEVAENNDLSFSDESDVNELIAKYDQLTN